MQIGSNQFKVSNGDSIFPEKLQYCDVNDKACLPIYIFWVWLISFSPNKGSSCAQQIFNVSNFYSLLL